MSKCPFHADSEGVSQEGEIESIQCSACGDYRISKTALMQLNSNEVPSGWLNMVASGSLISTRDTRALA
ncbi:MAG: hypothetical protein ACI9UU_002819 [Candidatus Azotimanducaceae bacterium]|jgi:hypothetical protein